MTTGPDLRIGDAERTEAAAELREHYALGRLSLAEFNQRLDVVFTATTRSQLHRITSDLPHVISRPAPLPVAMQAKSRQDGGPGSARHRQRLRFPAAVIALLLTWLVVVTALLPEFRVLPLPGKFGLLFIVFAVARGLLRLLFGRRRGSRSRRGCARGRCGWDHPGASWPRGR